MRRDEPGGSRDPLPTPAESGLADPTGNGDPPGEGDRRTDDASGGGRPPRPAPAAAVDRSDPATAPDDTGNDGAAPRDDTEHAAEGPSRASGETPGPWIDTCPKSMATTEPCRAVAISEQLRSAGRLSSLIYSVDRAQRERVAEIREFTGLHAERLRLSLARFPLVRLTGARAPASVDGCAPDVKLLRELYPGLSELPSADLYHWFEDYESTCRYRRGSRDRETCGFSHFLLGKMASHLVLAGERAVDAGELVAYAFLRGMDTDTAMRVGLESHRLRCAIHALRTLASCTCSNLLRAAEDPFPS